MTSRTSWQFNYIFLYDLLKFMFSAIIVAIYYVYVTNGFLAQYIKLLEN